ncbi:hypothetical protein MMC25_003346 [Agyrium rufum]|nr:hypothetical protein [Agyrium rufum]
MAFSFGGLQITSAQIPNGQIQSGPELREILTNALAFKTLNGEARIQLLPTPWPADSLPPPTSSLLSIAQNKGLLAAAGPESVVIASTESIRDAFSANSDVKANIKPFSPQLTLLIGTRISQVAFSADETYLAISAENGGGLAVYEVASLMQGNTQCAFEIGTDGVPIRALVPNPTVEKAEFFAVVLTNGQLRMANLKSRSFVNGPNGLNMKDGVSCVSWSTRGKQLVAGLGDGSGYQMTPEGQGKATIPIPPGLEGAQHVSAIAWLSNDEFLTAHTPNSFDTDVAPSSTYHIILRREQQFQSQKLPEVCTPFGVNRSPPAQFFQRLRDFPPEISDIIIVASTASEDINLFTKAKQPLTTDFTPSETTNVFTTTLIEHDAQRASVPLSEEFTPTSAIGMALDLSSKTKVVQPIQGDEELVESPGPLPALMLLNNQGVLSAWWVVYEASIRAKLPYPGLVAAAGITQVPQQTPQPQQQQQHTTSQPAQTTFGAPPAQSATPAFGSSGFGQPSSLGGGFGKPAKSLFGNSTPLGGATGGFGAPGGMGSKPSLCGAPPATTQPSGSLFGSATTSGQSTFGSATPLTGQGSAFGGGSAPSFGSSGGLGQKSSPWAQAASGDTSSTSAKGPSFGQSNFGQPGTFGGKPGGVFGERATNQASSGPTPFGGAGASSASPFSSFASKGGFASVTPQAGGGGFFGKPATPGASFGSGMDTSSFGAPSPQKEEVPKGSLFGLGGGFKLNSTFQGDGSAKNDTPKPAQPAGGSLFGQNFGSALNVAATTPPVPESKDEDMVSDAGSADESPAKDNRMQETTTPAATPAPKTSLFGTATPTAPPKVGGLFGTQAQSKDTPAAVGSSTPPASSSSPFANLAQPKDSPKKSPFSLPDTSKEEPAKPLFANFPKPSEAPTESPFANVTTPSEAATKSSFSNFETPKPVETPIKEEPTDDSTTFTTRLPEPPLPPDLRSKTSYKPADSSTSPIEQPKPSKEPDPPKSDFIDSNVNPKNLPISSPPPSLHSDDDGEFEDEEEGFEDEDDGEGEDDEEEPEREGEEDEEGSGIDIGQDVSSHSGIGLTPGISPESSHGAGQDKKNLGGLFTRVSLPEPSQSRPLFGELGKSPPPLFPPPTKVQQSPRSPSPIRPSALSDRLRPENQRSTSAPGPRSIPPPIQKPQPPLFAQSTAIPSKPKLSLQDKRREQEARARSQRAQQNAEEEQDLSDREDERIMEELNAPIEPTLELAPFLARHDYVGGIEKPGVPGQIEKVFRDVNSMIDTLGLNARSLESFIVGQSQRENGNEATVDDLENDHDWRLVEIADLVNIQQALADQLEQVSVKNPDEKLATCEEIGKQLDAISTKKAEITRLFAIHKDPELREQQRAAPLSTEQTSIRRDLRKDIIAFQKQLSELEENIVLLRAKLASSQPSGKDDRTGRSQRGPTVEAIQRTIMKITALAQEKSGDIDVLEAQMRRLNKLSLNDSREGSPFLSTPRGSLRRSIGPGGTPGSLNGANGLGDSFYTPKSARSGLGSSVGANGYGTPGSAGKTESMDVLLVEDVMRYAEKVARRKEIVSAMKRVFEKMPVRSKPMEESWE